MKRLLTLLFLFSLILSASAQDISFSQFYANRTYLNPAFTGMEKGIHFGSADRMQWYQVDKGYKTMGIFAEWQEPCINFGLGFSAFRVSEGLFNYNTTSIGVQIAKIIPGKKHNVHIGFSPRYVFRRFDDSKLIFSDELDPVFGAINPTGFVPVNDRTSFPDADFGVLWRFDGKMKQRGGTLGAARYSLGFSLHHLFGLFLGESFNESLLGLNTFVTPRLTLHGGAIVPTTVLEGVNRRFSLSPNFKFDMQGANLLAPGKSLRTLTLGTYVMANGFYLGGFYQSRNGIPTAKADTEALLFMAGWYFNAYGPRHRERSSYLIGFSMDVNLSGLGWETGNVYELVVRYSFSKGPNLFCKLGPIKTRQILDCKDFIY